MLVASSLLPDMALQSAAASLQLDPGASFDARWAAWLERGRQHELRVRRKVRFVFACAAVIGALSALVGFMRGAW